VTSVVVDVAQASLALDLEGRLREVPESALVRGVFFNLIEDELNRRGLGGSPVWTSFLGDATRGYRLYSVREWLTRVTTAAALVNPDPREGVREIFSGTARYGPTTPILRVFRRFLRPDPLSAFRWIERSREFFCNYGRWRVEKRGVGHATIHMFDEYIWIETAHKGGCEGLLHACGVEGEVVAELDDRFNGRLDVRWESRS
jgi:uncharacterized protein (TIGR02265 family)